MRVERVAVERNAGVNVDEAGGQVSAREIRTVTTPSDIQGSNGASARRGDENGGEGSGQRDGTRALEIDDARRLSFHRAQDCRRSERRFDENDEAAALFVLERDGDEPRTRQGRARRRTAKMKRDGRVDQLRSSREDALGSDAFENVTRITREPNVFVRRPTHQMPWKWLRIHSRSRAAKSVQ